MPTVPCDRPPVRVIFDETPIGDIYPPPTRAFPDPERARWPRRRTLLVLAGLGAMVALIGGGLWWNRVLAADPGLRLRGAALNVFRAAGDKTGITDVRNHLGDEAQVDFVPGGRFSAWMSLHNGGGRSLRIEAIPDTGFYYWGVGHVVVSDDPSVPFPEGARSMAPFTLPAGETTYLRVDFRLAACDPAGLQEGGSSTLGSLPVKYKVLGFSRTISVPFDDAAITVNAGGHCDRPIPDAE